MLVYQRVTFIEPSFPSPFFWAQPRLELLRLLALSVAALQGGRGQEVEQRRFAADVLVPGAGEAEMEVISMGKSIGNHIGKP